MRYITKKELEILSQETIGKTEWDSLTNNCSHFARKTWNKVTGDNLSIGFNISTPSLICDAIKKRNSYEYGKPLSKLEISVK